MEFTILLIVDTQVVQDKLYSVVNLLRQQMPDTLFNIEGDFNQTSGTYCTITTGRSPVKLRRLMLEATAYNKIKLAYWFILAVIWPVRSSICAPVAGFQAD